MDFISTCAAGLEDLVSTEIDGWNGRIDSSGRGFVRWTGPLEAGYRCCLWSRYSSRLILLLAEFEISDTDNLYEASKAVVWEDHLSESSSFAVDCVLTGRPEKAVLSNSMFGGLRVKDGIVDRLRDMTGRRPSVQTRRPDVQVYLQVEGAKVLMGLDLSGESLHRRGYRVEAGPAPLKENLAAAIVGLSGWDGSTALLDPMCGSATLLIEAALLYGDSAPGLGRSYFGLFGWHGHRADLWESLVAEALDREEGSQQKEWPRLFGYDGDKSAVAAARKNLRQAGLEDRVVIEHREIQRLKNDGEQAGHIICNPPYGERLTDKQMVRHLYRFMGERFRQEFSGWNITVFTAAPDYADQFRLDCRLNRKMHNGPLSCRLLSGYPLAGTVGADTSRGGQRVTLSGGDGSELANRLKKNFRKLHPWALSHALDCFRLYDRDLPQFNVTVDVVGTCFYINEFPPSSSADPKQVDSRFSQVISTVRDLFQVGRDRVIIRRGRSGQGSVDKKPVRQRTYEIKEGSAVFLAHLPGTPDTGFIIDQRFVRELIKERAGQGAFLSLFDTSGAATVRACLGGAGKTVTAGLSKGSRSYVTTNFSRNGMALENHRVVEEPVMAWLAQNRERFSLIYINLRRKTYGRGTSWSFDTLADHPALVHSALNCLTEGGSLLVSTLIPSFQLDPAVETMCCSEDISRSVFPDDLPKTARNFRCYRITAR